MNNRKTLIAVLCLLLPLLVLGGWAGSLLYDRAIAKDYHVIVQGYDPHDMLHGQYLNLRYVWDDKRSDKPDLATNDLPTRAQFYVPEWDAPDLESMLREGKHVFSADIVVMRKRTQIKTLLIDDKSWQEALAAWRENRDNRPHE